MLVGVVEVEAVAVVGCCPSLGLLGISIVPPHAKCTNHMTAGPCRISSLPSSVGRLYISDLHSPCVGCGISCCHRVIKEAGEHKKRAQRRDEDEVVSRRNASEVCWPVPCIMWA